MVTRAKRMVDDGLEEAEITFEFLGDKPTEEEIQETIREIEELQREEQEGKSTKHLPGQHSQSTHGRGGGGFSGKPANFNGKDTMEQFRRADGSWTPERKALHDQIVNEALSKATPVENPTAYMMGGGPASGKSAAIRSGSVELPENKVDVDSDEIKKSLPEFNELKKAGDSSAAAFVHEESSFLSKRIMKEAAEGKYNVLLDGTGDSSIEKLRRKVNTLRSGGQRVVANYVTVDTATAVQRNRDRAARTGRLVPESFVRNAHVQISRAAPKAVNEGLFDEFNLFDTNKQGEVRKVASAQGSNLTIQNQGLWDRFIAKGEQ